MKRLWTIALILALTVLPLKAFAVGTCVETYSGTAKDVQKVMFLCTADSAAGTFPATAFAATTMQKIQGWYLISGSVLNGGTGMTANSTLTLSTTNEGDILGGAGKGPTAATAALASKFKPIVDTTYLVPGLVPITADALTLQVTQAGSAVNSAVATIVFKFVK